LRFEELNEDFGARFGKSRFTVCGENGVKAVKNGQEKIGTTQPLMSIRGDKKCHREFDAGRS